MSMGNPSPVFVCSNLTVANIRPLGQDGRHFKLRVKQSGAALNVMAWDMAGTAGVLEDRAGIDVAFVPEFNEWQGQSSIQLRARDLRSRADIPTDICLQDVRNTADKVGFIVRLAKKQKVVVQVNDRRQVLALAARMRKLLPRKIGIYHGLLGDLSREKVLQGWQAGRVQVLISSVSFGDELSEKEYLVLCEPPLERDMFTGSCAAFAKKIAASDDLFSLWK